MVRPSQRIIMYYLLAGRTAAFLMCGPMRVRRKLARNIALRLEDVRRYITRNPPVETICRRNIGP